MANWTTGLTTASILGLVPLVLRFLSRQASLPTGRLWYGRGPKTIALLAGIAPPLAVAAALGPGASTPGTWGEDVNDAMLA